MEKFVKGQRVLDYHSHGELMMVSKFAQSMISTCLVRPRAIVEESVENIARVKAYFVEVIDRHCVSTVSLFARFLECI